MRAALLFLAIVSCVPPQTQAEACHRQNAANRFGRSINRQNSAVANAVEDSRCDAIEREERADARERASAESKAAAQRDARNAELDAQLATVRAAPSVPELGATTAEAKIMCERQRGNFAVAEGRFGCRVGGPVVFAGTVDDGRIVQTDAYYEGADLGSARLKVSSALGSPRDEQVSPDGFRVFTWVEPDRVVVLTMYAKGVRLSVQTRRG